jgi:hypothetical protein
MNRKLRLIASLAIAAMTMGAAAVATSSADEPTANASRACSVDGEQRDFPPASYVTSIKVRNTTCAKGKKVTRAYHRCRKNNGGANGRCNQRVLKFNCDEGDRSGVPGLQYNATVVCRRGERKITSTYTQNV